MTEPVTQQGAAGVVYGVIARMLGRPPGFRLTSWDGGCAGPPGAPLTAHLTNPRAVQRLMWQPNELGLARAYITGDLLVDGDLVAAMAATFSSSAPFSTSMRGGLLQRAVAARVAARVGALGPPVAPPAGEVKLRGRRHSRRRDAAAVSHHYDVGNEFYRLMLDESMTYSCAYWRSDPSPAYTLADAQADKYELICRKLGLRPGMRLLDVGCGWGGMVMYAAANYGVTALGITLSREQETLARKRISQAGLGDAVEVQLCDYRELEHATFDAISSIGMAEHVGAAAFAEYAGRLHALLAGGGRLLNHQISMPDGQARQHGPSFIDRYIFPDGELLPIGQVVTALELAGFEVRDVESLRENYYLTLLQWIDNLGRNRERAVEIVGAERVRTWELYLAGSAAAFQTGHIGIHQTLAVKPVDGCSGLPRIREHWLVSLVSNELVTNGLAGGDRRVTIGGRGDEPPHTER